MLCSTAVIIVLEYSKFCTEMERIGLSDAILTLFAKASGEDNDDRSIARL